jgi:membrane-associated phospholipid phosphatase
VRTAEQLVGFQESGMPLNVLLRRSALALVACMVFVTVAYYFVDQPVAFFVHDQRLKDPDLKAFLLLRGLTYIPNAFPALVLLVLVLCLVQGLRVPSPGYQKVAGCGLLVAVAYFFVENPVAYLVHEPHPDEFSWLKVLPEMPDAFPVLPLVVLSLCLVPSLLGPLPRYQKVGLAASISLLVTVAALAVLKIVFGRYWPETWIDGNPSLIGNGAYGFHPFHYGVAYGSFPSGHTARTLSVVSVVWICYPWWRWACVLVAGAVVVGLIGMDYHFVGDTIGGAFLGGMIGAWIVHFFPIDAPSSSSPQPAEHIGRPST